MESLDPNPSVRLDASVRDPSPGPAANWPKKATQPSLVDGTFFTFEFVDSSLDFLSFGCILGAITGTGSTDVAVGIAGGAVHSGGDVMGVSIGSQSIKVVFTASSFAVKLSLADIRAVSVDCH